MKHLYLSDLKLFIWRKSVSKVMCQITLDQSERLVSLKSNISRKK